MNPYETEKLVHEYLLFHYGEPERLLPHSNGPDSALHFPVRTVTENLQPTKRDRALDLGCAVGRSAFELSKFCQNVFALDYSSAFIEAAEKLRSGVTLEYSVLEEGHVYTNAAATAPADAEPARIEFGVGDAMALPDDLGAFDVVHAANLLCRLPEPAQLLQRFPDLVAPGGELVLTTPCTWLEEFTPAEHWPEGQTFDWLENSLSPAFSLVSRRDMPFLIRETARKFQWTVALTTVWKRNP